MSTNLCTVHLFVWTPIVLSCTPPPLPEELPRFLAESWEFCQPTETGSFGHTLPLTCSYTCRGCCWSPAPTSPVAATTSWRACPSVHGSLRSGPDARIKRSFLLLHLSVCLHACACVHVPMHACGVFMLSLSLCMRLWPRSHVCMRACT